MRYVATPTPVTACDTTMLHCAPKGSQTTQQVGSGAAALPTGQRRHPKTERQTTRRRPYLAAAPRA